MVVNEITCAGILTRVTGYLKEVVSHSINPYIGCGFGKSSCGVGCYVRHNQWLLKGRKWGGFVDIKMNSAELYRKSWKAEGSWAVKRGRKFSLFCSSSTDPWQPIERRYRITRSLLMAMLEAPPDELILQTHTDIVMDDRDTIAELDNICSLRLHVSIEGDRDRLHGLPPPPCSVESRLRLVEEFSSIGVSVIVCLSPLYPMLKPDKFFRRLADVGASAAVIDHFIGGDGSLSGSRTFKTPLPKVMAKVHPESINHSYLDEIVLIARRYLPIGISQEGFAGKFLTGGEKSSD